MEAVSLENPVLTAVRGLHNKRILTADGGRLVGALQEGHAASRVVLVVGDNVPGREHAIQSLAHELNGAFRDAEGMSSWLFLEEPEAGLADGYCLALGAYLGNLGNHVTAQCVMVVSHSRKLMSALTFSLQHTPHVLCLGDYQTGDKFQAWLEDERERTVDELLALTNAQGARWRHIEELIARNKAR
jgi:hypothetical protein